MIWKRSAGKAASNRKALTVLLENDGKVVFEASTAEMSKPIVIGRGAGCDWCTAGIDGSISGRHAEIYLRRGTPHIRDLGSRNGIYSHGQRVQDVRLSPGDTLLIGACSLSVERPAQGAQTDGQPRHHRLEQLNGPDAGRVIDLVGPADVRIGSDPSCSIVCLDTLVSHSHAVIAFKQDWSCWVSDLGSRNGSAVNGVALKKERMLRDGDILSIAYIEFRFHDRNVVHASANVGRKAAVIAATVTVALMLYFVYNALVPPARAYIETARKCAAEERWGDAFENLDKAMVARYASAYAANVTELRSNIAAWTNTLSHWKSAQTLLGEKRWVTATQLFHDMNDWRWNNGGAVAAKEEAGRTERLLRAFLSSRELLRETEWADGVSDKFGEEAGELRASLAAFGEKPPKFAALLVENAADVLGELDAAIGDFQQIEALRKALDAAVFSLDDLGNPIGGRALARLSALIKDNEARGAYRHAQSESNKLNVCRFSEIPGQRMAAFRDVIAKYSEAERALYSNMVCLATESYDDVAGRLPLPSQEECGKFGVGEYRKSLEAANETLVTRGRGLRTQMANISRAGFDFDHGVVNPDFAKLLDPATTRAALRFVSPSDTPVRVDSEEPVCPYDEFAGVIAFGEFLARLTDDGSRIAEFVEGYGGDDVFAKWKPLLRRARDAYEVLNRFLNTVVRDRSGFLAKIAELDLPEGENRVKLALGFAEKQRRLYRYWRGIVFPAACSAEGSPRATILSQGVSLILADQPSELAAAQLFVRWKDFRRTIPDDNGKRIVRQDIINTDLPNNKGKFMSAWKAEHEALEREKGEGGGE